MTYVVVTPPTEEPISLAEAQAHLKVDAGDEDALISALIVGARQHVENYIKRYLCTTVIEKYLDAFQSEINLIYGPIQSVDSVKYQDSTDTEQTVDDTTYSVDRFSDPARIKINTTWPSTNGKMNCVTVRYTAGYGASADVPQAIKQAMLLIIGRMYEQREDTVYKMPTSSENLLLPYIVY